MKIPHALGAFATASQVPMTIAAPFGDEHPLLFANAAFERLTGFGAAEMVGRDCRLLQGPNTQPGARAAIRRGLREQGDVQTVITNHRRDGEAFENYLFLFPLLDEGGRRRLFVGSQCALPPDHRAHALVEHGAFLRNSFADLLRADLGGLRIETRRLSELDEKSLVMTRLANFAGGRARATAV
jgi:PAS domain S-box-containing protein